MNDKERNKRFRASRSAVVKRQTRIIQDTEAEIRQLLKLANEEITLILANAPTDWEQFYLPQLQQSVNVAMTQFGGAATATVGLGARLSTETGVALIEEPLAAGGVRIVGAVPRIDPPQLQAMRTFMTGRIKDISLSAANTINSELGLTAIGVQSQGQAVAHIQRLLQNGSRSRAITIVRTELGRAYSVASDQRFRESQPFLPGLKKEWRKSGRIHSRPRHDAINGQVREVDKPFTLANGTQLMFPRDPKAPAGETINCGCTSLPFMAHWETVGLPIAT